VSTDEARPRSPAYDRRLLLGEKRNEELSLDEIHRYGADSFGDPEYLCLYGLPPTEWYARGVRILGRTAVECTRDALADRIGRDTAAVASRAAAETIVVLDPFAGSCNTLFWIARHLRATRAVGFELDGGVYESTRRNLSVLSIDLELVNADYEDLLPALTLPADALVVVYVAPPWGNALDERSGLDLRRTTPPLTEVVRALGDTLRDNHLLFVLQLYETVVPASVGPLTDLFSWWDRRTYDLNAPGRNHGVGLGTMRWQP
jgi:16S rRNA G966 N2-methylase RsmD